MIAPRKPSRWRFLIPIIEVADWFGDGPHDETTVVGECIEFSGLGLHFCFVAAVERSW